MSTITAMYVIVVNQRDCMQRMSCTMQKKCLTTVASLTLLRSTYNGYDIGRTTHCLSSTHPLSVARSEATIS